MPVPSVFGLAPVVRLGTALTGDMFHLKDKFHINDRPGCRSASGAMYTASVRPVQTIFTLLTFAAFGTAFGQLQPGSVTAIGVHPNVVLLTHDDGFDELAPDGTNQTMTVARQEYSWGIPDTFFVVGCHFTGMTTTDPRSSLCLGPGDRPMSLLNDLAAMDFVPMNHSFSHVIFTDLQPAEMIWEVQTPQLMFNPYQKELGLHLLRCPGFQCYDREVGILNSQREFQNLKGPINADVGGWMYEADGVTPMGGDWDCIQKGYTPEACGELYVRDIKQFSAYNGVVVLLHVRTELMTGAEGTGYPSKLLSYIYNNLGPEYTYTPLDAIPGLLGNIQTRTPELVSAEFGTGDGDGSVLYGDLDGDGRADACKARGAAVWCMLNAAQPDSASGATGRFRMMSSTNWLGIDDPAWASQYGKKFWLVDWNQDGKKDLVYPVAQGFMVALSNGSSFNPPELWPVQLAQGGWTLDVLNTVRFGDLNGDGKVDVIALTAQGIVGATNAGSSFDPPLVRSAYFASGGWTAPQYATTLQFRDINGDGLDDICIRGSGETMVGLSDGREFQTGAGWSARFNDRQGWNDPAQYQTFSLARINGTIGIAGGVSSGIVFQKADLANSRFALYRYLNNEDYSTDPAWKPERYASGLAFADFDGSGNESPALTRSDGLYVGLIRILKE